MFPALVPGGFRQFRSDPVDGFFGACDAEHSGTEADDRGVEGAIFGVLAVEGDLVPLSLAAVDAVEVPEVCEAGEEGAWDGTEG